MELQGCLQQKQTNSTFNENGNDFRSIRTLERTSLDGEKNSIPTSCFAIDSGETTHARDNSRPRTQRSRKRVEGTEGRRRETTAQAHDEPQQQLHHFQPANYGAAPTTDTGQRCNRQLGGARTRSHATAAASPSYGWRLSAHSCHCTLEARSCMRQQQLALTWSLIMRHTRGYSYCGTQTYQPRSSVRSSTRHGRKLKQTISSVNPGNWEPRRPSTAQCADRNRRSEGRCPRVLRSNDRLGSQWVLSGLSKSEHFSKS